MTFVIARQKMIQAREKKGPTAFRDRRALRTVTEKYTITLVNEHAWAGLVVSDSSAASEGGRLILTNGCRVTPNLRWGKSSLDLYCTLRPRRLCLA